MNGNRLSVWRHPLLLPVLSVAAFWVMPFSPWLSMAAVSQTRDVPGTPRKLAIVGAVLCAVYAVGMAGLLAGLFVSLWVG